MGPKSIIASTEATDLLLRLQAQHGPLLLQISGSYGVSVICLPLAELRLGARDLKVGEVSGTPVFMMLNEARYWDGTDIAINVAKGVGVGFSLEGPERVHFTLRKRADPKLRDWTGQGVPITPSEG